MGRWLLLIASTLVALLVAEGLSRLLAPTDFMKPLADDPARPELLHRPSAVPGLAYELRPNATIDAEAGHVIRSNAEGMRGPEIPDAAAGCTVLALGDSYTFGFAVGEDEVWPAVLERRLGELVPGSAPRVLNMAVTGYSTRDEALALRHKGVGYRPDLVVVGYVLNDPETLYPWAAAPLRFHAPAWWQHSNLLRLAAQGRRALGIRRTGGSLVRYLHAPAGEGWASVAAGFADIAALSREHGFRVLVAIFPMVDGPDWGAYPFRDVHQQVARLAVQNGFEVLDLLDAWQRYPVLQVVVSAQDVHPNATGHRVTGEAIAAAVARAGLAGAACARPPTGNG